MSSLLRRWNPCLSPSLAGYKELHPSSPHSSSSPLRRLHCRPFNKRKGGSTKPRPWLSNNSIDGLDLDADLGLVQVVAGSSNKKAVEEGVFLVEPWLLEHYLIRELLLKADERKVRSKWGTRIYLNCDPILFDFFLALVQQNDPAIRDLNLNDLMEFYNA